MTKKRPGRVTLNEIAIRVGALEEEREEVREALKEIKEGTGELVQEAKDRKRDAERRKALMAVLSDYGSFALKLAAVSAMGWGLWKYLIAVSL